MASGTRKKILGLATVAVALAAMVGVGLLLGPAAGQNTSTSESTEITVPVRLPTETIERGDLVETTDAVGTIDNGDAWPAAIDSHGIVTKRHDRGALVEPGQPLIWVDDQPVLLAKGSTPMYRTLELRGSTKAKHLSGEDVRQLQEFLLGQGFDDKSRLEADGVFGISTQRAVKAWQKDNGWEQSGTVDRSRLVFHPTALRIDSTPQIGAVLAELQVTEAAQRITADFDNKSRAFLTVGSTVTLDPDGEIVGDDGLVGRIVEVTPTVGDDGTQVLRAVIDPARPVPDGTRRITVEATRTAAGDVLIVPVRAILALAGGGYGLEVETAAGHELRAVDLGAIVDDLVEISGDFVEGEQVVVPNDQLGGQS